MRILSYNIHGCIGRDGREDPDRILSVIESTEADIVGLQEVDRNDTPDQDLIKRLKALAYPTVLYGKTMRKPSSDYGNVLLLRKRPEQVKRIELPSQRGEPRGAIIADCTFAGEQIRIINTHWDLLVSERRQQAESVIAQLPSSPDHRCILLGDLNEWLPCRRYFRELRNHFTDMANLRTFPTHLSIFPLDRIALFGSFSKYRFQTIRNNRTRQASDHYPLVCDLSL